MQCRSISGARSRQPRLVAVLTSSFASLAFSKYRRAQTTPIIDLHCIIRFILLVSTVLHSAGFRKYRRAQIASLTDLLCICRCICLISTVLLFVGLSVTASSHYPLPCLYCICRFDFQGSTVLGFVCYPKALISLDSPLTEYTAIALPQDLFTQLIG